jgi:hypothetical protein
MSGEEAAVQTPCEDSVWHAEEESTLEIEVNGETLSPRTCELRHIGRSRVAAVKLEIEFNEMASLVTEDALTWRFTLRKKGALLREERGWKVARLERAGEWKYHICLEPV